MPKISELSAPAALSGLELVPILQGGGSDANCGLPLLATRSVPSGAVLILRKPMTADLSATADADPGAGKVRWNNATPASATVLYIDDVDTAASDIATPLATVQIGGYVYLQADSTSARRDCWQKLQVASITGATGYTKIGVTYVAGAGTWTADETLELTVQQPTPASATNRNVVTTLTSSSGAVTVDLSLGDYFKLTPTETITSWTFSNDPSAYSIAIVLEMGSTAYTVAMPSGLKWPGGTAGAFSTAANKRDELSIRSIDSGATKCALLAKDFA